MASDQEVLTFGDTTLHTSDLRLLRPGYWLNDNLIQFYYE
jgi:Ulp1 family protease